MNRNPARNKKTMHLFLAILAISLIPLTSLADAQGQGSDGNREAAREYYKQGKALYEAGKFEEAQKEFQAAYDAQPHPVVLKSIAECKAAQGNITGAIETLEKFLASPEATGKPEVETRLEQLKGMLVPVDVASDPPGASIQIDGDDQEEETPATFKLNPGEYKITLLMKGYEPITKSVNLKIGSVSSVSVDYTIDGIPVTESKADADDLEDPFEEEEVEEDDKDGLPTGFWISAAVAGVGVVSGTVFGAMALSAQKDFDTEPTQATADSGKVKAVLADVSFGVAAAAAIAGTIIFIVNRNKETDEPESAKWGIAPVASRESFGLNAVVEF